MQKDKRKKKELADRKEEEEMEKLMHTMHAEDEEDDGEDDKIVNENIATLHTGGKDAEEKPTEKKISVKDIKRVAKQRKSYFQWKNEFRNMLNQRRDSLLQDPFYNQNLSLNDESFAINLKKIKNLKLRSSYKI